MAYTIKKAEVWAGDFKNRPEKLARVLEALDQAGAQLEFLVVRRVTENTSRFFLSPLKGKKQKAVAEEVGFRVASGLYTLRIEGPDRKGLGAGVSRSVAAAGINIRSASAATIGRNGVFYLAFKTEDEAKDAAKVIRKKLRPSRK